MPELSPTLADLERDGFSAIRVICRRCSHAAVFAIPQFHYRSGMTLARMKELVHCARCASKLDNPERHHDLTLVPLRPNETWGRAPK